MSEFRFPKDGYYMTRVKRDWVPEWLYRIYAAVCPPWLEPIRWILHRELPHDDS